LYIIISLYIITSFYIITNTGLGLGLGYTSLKSKRLVGLKSAIDYYNIEEEK